jgi:hypothetical protein
MTRRAVCVAAWLLTVSMDALVVWALVDGTFLGSMLASLPAEQRVQSEGMLIVADAAIAGVIAVTLAYATVGLLLASRRGGGRVGAILLAGGASFAAVPFGYVIGGTLVLQDPLGPVANVLFLVGPASVSLGYSLILPVVALTFPDGHLPSPTWRWPVGVALGALAAATILTVLRPGEIAETVSWNPLGIDALPAWLSSLAGPLSGIGIVLISVLGIAAVVTRYRRASGLERQQLRWFVAAVLLAVVPINIAALPGSGGPGWLILAVFGLLLVPVSVGIAVTRYRLYEIDRLISRTIGWALVTGVLVAVFAGTVVGLQAILSSITQGQTLAVAASTLAAFAVFQPVRRRIQSAVDHRFNRACYDAEQTAAAFSARMRDEVDIAAVTTDLNATVHGAIRPASLGLWIRGNRP